MSGSHASDDSFLAIDATPLGDSALTLHFDHLRHCDIELRLFAALAHLQANHPSGVMECVSAWETIAVFFDPHVTSFTRLREELLAKSFTLAAREPSEQRLHEIPVCYAAAFAPDLAEAAERSKLTIEEFTRLHASAEYRVRVIGFSPGFPYLAGLPSELTQPRLAQPRLRVPAGSVAIGGEATGIYPLAVPGGWRIIGRTPLALFDPQRAEPCLLSVGDRVRFRAITLDEFVALSESAP